MIKALLAVLATLSAAGLGCRSPRPHEASASGVPVVAEPPVHHDAATVHGPLVIAPSRMLCTRDLCARREHELTLSAGGLVRLDGVAVGRMDPQGIRLRDGSALVRVEGELVHVEGLAAPLTLRDEGSLRTDSGTWLSVDAQGALVERTDDGHERPLPYRFERATAAARPAEVLLAAALFALRRRHWVDDGGGPPGYLPQAATRAERARLESEEAVRYLPPARPSQRVAPIAGMPMGEVSSDDYGFVVDGLPALSADGATVVHAGAVSVDLRPAGLVATLRSPRGSAVVSRELNLSFVDVATNTARGLEVSREGLGVNPMANSPGYDLDRERSFYRSLDAAAERVARQSRVYEGFAPMTALRLPLDAPPPPAAPSAPSESTEDQLANWRPAPTMDELAPRPLFDPAAPAVEAVGAGLRVRFTPATGELLVTGEADGAPRYRATLPTDAAADSGCSGYRPLVRAAWALPGAPVVAYLREDFRSPTCPLRPPRMELARLSGANPRSAHRPAPAVALRVTSRMTTELQDGYDPLVVRNTRGELTACFTSLRPLSPAWWGVMQVAFVPRASAALAPAGAAPPGFDVELTGGPSGAPELELCVAGVLREALLRRFTGEGRGAVVELRVEAAP